MGVRRAVVEFAGRQRVRRRPEGIVGEHAAHGDAAVKAQTEAIVVLTVNDGLHLGSG